MATSKLLKPTNVTISIPGFTDQPDQRVNSNCMDKEADAINALFDQIAKHEVPRTKNTEHSFSGSGVSTWSLVLASDKLITLTAYNGGNITMYTPSGDNSIAVCSATAPSNVVQFSCGNTVYCKAGTYTVYYYGASSSSSGAVSSWS